jgi:transketolase
MNAIKPLENSNMPTRRTRQGYADALIALAGEMPELVVLDADVAKATQTCDFAARFPDRFFNCGAAEQNELSVAAGMALEGFLPFATTFGMFATKRAADQFRNSICYSRLNVKVAATHCGISTGGDGASHQDNEDLAMTRAMPHLTVLVPGDYEEARLATLAAARYPGPVYLRLGRDEYPTVPEIHGEFIIGKAKLLRPPPSGSVVIVSTGVMVSEALRAADILDTQGVPAGVIHMPTIKPLDTCGLVEACRNALGVVTAEEHSIIGGLGEAVSACLAEALPLPVRKIGVRDVFGESGRAAELFDKFGLRSADIVRAALELRERAGASRGFQDPR